MQKRPAPSLIASLLARFRANNPSGKKNSTQLKQGSRPTATVPRPFQAISIFHGTHCCNIAKQLDGYRFLAKSAPQLPLSDCTMRDKCECRYMKHGDRRGDSRRMIDYGVKPQLFAARDRRAMRGRRGKD